MPHLHKKKKNGHVYYHIREIQRVNGKPKVIWQKYLGTAETMYKRLVENKSADKPEKVKTFSFGAVFMLNELENELDTIGIIDSIVPRGKKETGPTIGEYFYYGWVNRIINPRSKRALSDWYKHTAVQYIRPVDLKELTSQRYWEKFDRVSEQNIEEIAKTFFGKVWEKQSLSAEFLLFDTTNYYTFMNSKTDSELCQRGHNKASRHNLRQVGLGLLVDKKTHLPLFYKTYRGNMHDSKLFTTVMDQVFDSMCEFNKSELPLTVVFDKGMNSDKNINMIDENSRTHFITTYSPSYVKDLASTALKEFTLLDISNNKLRKGSSVLKEDLMVAYRSAKELWGKKRTVVITFNPRSYRKKEFTFNKKINSIREILHEFKLKYSSKESQWRDTEAIEKRYFKKCRSLNISSKYFDLSFDDTKDKPVMTYRTNTEETEKAKKLFGRSVIVTDNHAWSTDEIVQLSLDRYIIENEFRASKSKEHIRINPIYHWTDSKIRCHLLMCVIALTVLRLLEIRVNNKQRKNRLSGKTIIDEMSNLDSVCFWYPRKRKAEQMLEEPTKIQGKILKAFGYEIEKGVLQNSSL